MMSKNKMFLWALLVMSPLFWLKSQDTINLEGIVVQDKRLASTWRESTRPVHLVNSVDVQTTPGSSIEELLSFVPGLDVQQKGVHGIQADLNIRGGTFEQTLILINGVRMNDIQTGHHHFNLPLAPMAIERIEVVKGPAARRYGQNAYAGAVNIITKKPVGNRLTLRQEYGEFDTYAGDALLEIAGDKTTHMAQLRLASSDGYRHNTDYIKYNAWYQTNTQTKFGQLRFQGGYTKKDFGANGFYASPNFTEQYEEVETSMISGEADIFKGKWDINPRVYWRRNEDMYLFIRNDPSVLRNLHTSNQVGLEVNAQYADALGGTGIGMDVRREFLESNNLGYRDRTLASFFLEKNILLYDGKLELTPGMTYSYFSDFGSFFFPGIDVGYHVSDRSTVFANAGQTYRVPSFTDLYYQDPANLGNEDLEPESALAFELGYRYVHSRHHFSASVFARDTDDLIDWVKSNEQDRWKPQNSSSLLIYGAEMQYDYWMGHKWVDRLSLGYTFLENTDIENQANFSRYALQILQNQLVCRVQHQIWPGRISHHLIYRYTDRINLESYHLLDSRIQYDGQDNMNVFLMVNNWLDTEYRESNLVPMPGRWIRVGVQVGLDL